MTKKDILQRGTKVLVAAGLGISGYLPLASTASAADCFKYTVRRGDTTWDIGQRYNLTVAEIQADNPWIDPPIIHAGNEFIICPHGGIGGNVDLLKPNLPNRPPAKNVPVIETGTFWSPDSLKVDNGVDHYLSIPAGTEKWFTVNASTFQDGHKLLLNLGAVKEMVVAGQSASIDQAEARLYSPARYEELLAFMRTEGTRPNEIAEAHARQAEDPNFNSWETTYGFESGSSEQGIWLLGIANKQQPGGKRIDLVYRTYKK